MNPNKNTLLLLSRLPLGKVSLVSQVGEVAHVFYLSVWNMPTSEVTFIWHF